MKIAKLKEMLDGLDDDLDVYISPLIEIAVVNRERDSDPLTSIAPSPFERYRLTQVVQAGVRSGPGIYDNCLLLGFDRTSNSAKFGDEITGGDDFIN